MKNQGFTLIETMVSLTIFVVVSIALAQIIVISVQNQVKISLTQNLLNQSSYAVEYMSKSLRMAKKDTTGVCLGLENSEYNFQVEEGENPSITFLSYDPFDQTEPYKCKKFIFATNNVRLMVSSDDSYENFQEFSGSPSLFSTSVKVEDFKISVTGDGADMYQPRITLNFKVSSDDLVDENPIKMQTTISQRRLDL